MNRKLEYSLSFFKKYVYLFLTVLGLSGGTQDLQCGVSTPIVAHEHVGS